MKPTSWIVSFIFVALGVACSAEAPAQVGPGKAAPSGPKLPSPTESAKTRSTFGSYWYQGLAELNRFSLEQSRYGEIHKGEAVQIYVTEDFLTDKQVKYEFGDRSSAVGILKLNAYRRFYTGLYPYNLLTSVFTPVGGASRSPLKVTFSAQEWCGHVYSQLNLRGGKYEGIGHSYFQAEADSTFSLPDVLLEDDVFVRIRRDPSRLPTGAMKVVPAMHYLRLLHKDPRALDATATLKDASTTEYGEGLKVYEIRYAGVRRVFRVFYEPAFPYQILGFEEESPGLGGRVLTTKAKRTHAALIDYWNRNGNRDAPLRDSLGLEW
jgi:hypothetical protein